MDELIMEGIKGKTLLSIQQMLAQSDNPISTAVKELKNVTPDSLTEPRGIGRKQIPPLC